MILKLGSGYLTLKERKVELEFVYDGSSECKCLRMNLRDRRS